MNGNNPYAGAPGVTDAGSPAAVDLSPDQERQLRRAVAGIVSRTESYLPDSYAVGSELSVGADGPQATVAVNPYVGQAGEPLQMAAARMARVAGVRSVPERAHFKAKLAAGDLSLADLEAGLAEVPELDITVDALIAAMDLSPPAPQILPTLADLAEEVSDVNWPDFVADRIGHWASGHYDTGQALWPAPGTRAWLSWRSFAQRDLTPEIFGLTGFASRVASMSMSARGALTTCAEDMGITAEASESYFHTLLMRLGGWAQLASGEAFRASLKGAGNNDITDLLTAKLVFEAALLARYKDKIGARWEEVLKAHAQPIVPGNDGLADIRIVNAITKSSKNGGERIEL